MDFWPNLELPDLAEHGWGLPQDPPTIPNKPFQWATHKNKNRLPAWCEMGVDEKDQALNGLQSRSYQRQIRKRQESHKRGTRETQERDKNDTRDTY